MSPQTSPLKVLYVCCWFRSGSTILDNVIGEVPGYLSVGELDWIWHSSLMRGRPCGCGQPLSECELWAEVTRHLFQRLPVAERSPDKIVEWGQQSSRVRHTRKLLRASKGNPHYSPSLAHYLEAMEALYDSIAEVTGARVIVDSSKVPSGAAVRRLLPNVDLYLLHLVRDPRAVAYSHQRRKPLSHPGNEAFMATHSPLASTSKWLIWNVQAEAVARQLPPERVLRIRYEDFVSRPRATIGSILDFVRESGSDPFSDDRTVDLSPNHTVSGNSDRFRRGLVTIREDNEWRLQQSGFDNIVATLLSGPLLHRYGYKLRARVES